MVDRIRLRIVQVNRATTKLLITSDVTKITRLFFAVFHTRFKSFIGFRGAEPCCDASIHQDSMSIRFSKNAGANKLTNRGALNKECVIA